MANRYTRDEILHAALDMAIVPTLEAHDKPEGTIVPHAFCIRWLQEAIDLFHNRYPFASTLTSTSFTINVGQQSINLPSNFIIDVRNCLLINIDDTWKRVRRQPFQKWMSLDLMLQDHTNVKELAAYVIMPPLMKVTPAPDVAISAILWYYALPPVLDPNDVPNFPDDNCLIEYVRIRCREWIRAHDPGTALAYAERCIASLRQSGLFHEPEDDEIPFDTSVYRHGQVVLPYAWMGEYGT